MSSAETAGHVDGARDDAAGERRHHLLGGLKAGPVGRLGGRGAQVRGDDHVRVAEQRMLGDGLGAEHVERGARHLAGVERRLQVLVDDQRAAGDVEDAHAVPALGQHLGVQPALGVRVLGQMQGEEVRGRVHVVGRVGLLDAELAIALGAHERVEGDHLHLKAAGALGDELADPSEAEDPERLLAQLDAAELRALPLAAGQRRVRLRECCAPARAAAPSCARRR